MTNWFDLDDWRIKSRDGRAELRNVKSRTANQQKNCHPRLSRALRTAREFIGCERQRTARINDPGSEPRAMGFHSVPISLSYSPYAEQWEMIVLSSKFLQFLSLNSGVVHDRGAHDCSCDIHANFYASLAHLRQQGRIPTASGTFYGWFA